MAAAQRAGVASTRWLIYARNDHLRLAGPSVLSSRRARRSARTSSPLLATSARHFSTSQANAAMHTDQDIKHGSASGSAPDGNFEEFALTGGERLRAAKMLEASKLAIAATNRELSPRARRSANRALALLKKKEQKKLAKKAEKAEKLEREKTAREERIEAAREERIEAAREEGIEAASSKKHALAKKQSSAPARESDEVPEETSAGPSDELEQIALESKGKSPADLPPLRPFKPMQNGVIAIPEVDESPRPTSWNPFAYLASLFGKREEGTHILAQDGVSKYKLISMRDLRSKDRRAALNARVVEESRTKQFTPNGTTEGDTSKKYFILPGTGTGARVTHFDFESTELIYPPPQLYPPILPRMPENELVTTARIFGVHRYSDVEYVSGFGRDDPGSWRRRVRDSNYYVDNKLFEYLDGEQNFEYIGDSVLHLLLRSILMERYPRRSLGTYNLAANFLASNDVFGHVFDDAKLGEERLRIWRAMIEVHKQHELKKMASEGVSNDEIERRRKLPTPPAENELIHQRKADLFEAYTGAVYLTYGFSKVSRWVAHLFEPWIERVGRTPGFISKYTLTHAGIAQHRAERRQREAEEEERLQLGFRQMGGVQRFARGMLSLILPRRLFPDLRDDALQVKRQERSDDEDNDDDVLGAPISYKQQDKRP